MAITTHQEDLLPDLHPNLDEAATLTGCWGFGPIKVCWTFQGSSIRVCVYLLGVEIGCATLDASNPEFCVGAALPPLYPLAKANICVYADFNQRLMGVKGEACARPPGGSWNCARFDEIVFRW